MKTDKKAQWHIKISKEELAALPAAEYKGTVKVIDTEAGAIEAAALLGKEIVVGFDTETKPSFKKGQSNNVSLLQISTHDTCYLFRLNLIGLMPEVKAILENPDITKIGLSIHDDFHNLHKIFDLSPAGFIDLQNYVKDFKIADNSLSKIYAVLFDRRISKGQRLTNWEASSLTPNQQIYASLDARACLEIYDFLEKGEFDPASSPYRKVIEEPVKETEKTEEKA